MANAELLQRTLEHIKANPEQWDQWRFIDCFAGWTVRLNTPNVTTRVQASDCGPECCPSYLVLIDDAGERIGVSDMAMELLELTPDQASELFRGDNEMDDLERIVSELTAQEAVSA